MNPSSGNKGVNGLAQAFVGEIDRRRSKDSALVLDFGEIQDDYSLKTNTFSIPIPVEDYHVCRQLTLGKTGDILAKTQAIGKPGSGEHDHKTFELNSIHGPVKGTIGTPASGQPDPPDPPQNSAGSGGPEGAHQHHVLIPEKMRRLETRGPGSGGLGAVGGRCGGYYLPGGGSKKITRRKEGLSYG